ncbi:MAG: bacteriohemerythrin [Candidatus Thorarchaeota archaeon]|nr:MAG: hemerythrin [Candidatus Thorarchaeota archaeon]RLI56824.1 MAG: hemerythrin [Candidatus Thorarchaeota archaeon]
MTGIAWNDSLSVGINLIDEQHKMLIQKIKDLSDAIDRQQGADKILLTLDFMIKYTDFHFGTEEKHMRELSYPAMEDHIQKHQEFKEMLQNMLADFDEEGATKALGDSINTYLMNWLVNHITRTDVAFGQFLKEKGLSELE